MNLDGRRIGVAGRALVLPRVRGLRRLDEEPRGGYVATLLGYHRDAAPGTVVAQDFLIVVPEDVSWRLRAEVYGARQVYRATRSHVQIWTTQYRRCRHCDKERILLLSFPSSATRVAPTAPLDSPVRDTRYFGSIPEQLPHEEPPRNDTRREGRGWFSDPWALTSRSLLQGPRSL